MEAYMQRVIEQSAINFWNNPWSKDSIDYAN